ncbi:BtpA/SgcQ family protein [bacterium]|nr:BtpA/SgcQ family protein [bacterium]
MNRAEWTECFGISKPLIGMVHLAALPGSPGYEGDFSTVLDKALADAEAIVHGGFDAVMVENFGDVPFWGNSVPPVTVAAMTQIVDRICTSVELPVGVNVLRNDALSALSIAAVTDAAFIRINVHTGVTATDQGILTGSAAETLRARQALGSDVKILADVFVKHGRPMDQTDIAAAAKDCAYRGLADGIIITGIGTGTGIELADLEAVRIALPDYAVLGGSGLSEQTAWDILSVADGAIVGTSIKTGGRVDRPVDRERVAGIVGVRDRLLAAG